MIRGKKIAFISYANFPFGGAMANFSRYLASGLTFQNNKVEVILPTGNYYGNKVDCSEERQGVINGVSYKHLCFINHPKNRIGKVADNVCGFILPLVYIITKSLRKDLDIIIISDSDFFKTIAFLIVKKVFRKKLLIILPEFYEKPTGRRVSLSLINWYSFYFGLQFVVKHADYFIVLSNFMRRYLIDALHIKKKILLIPNLIDPKKFEIGNVNPYFKDKITIGYVGTPTKKDGALDLIKSFSLINKKYPNTHLLMIGDITNGKTIVPELKRYAEVNGINVESITFTGLQSHLAIPELLLSCQILALTRPNGVFAEAGFPTKLGEYFSSRKPVIITKVGDIPTYFKNEEQVILVEPEDIQSIVEGFEKLLKDVNLQYVIGQNGYRWMEDNLNYIKQSRRISDFLNN